MTVGGLLSVEAEIFVYGFLWGFIAGMCDMVESWYEIDKEIEQ